jgi:phage shock protein E
MNKIAVIVTLSILTLFAVTAVFGGDKQAPVVIDVRTESEWNAGHLQGAVLIPHEQIAEGISKIESDKKAKIYLYCRSGRRSGLALDVLKKSGYEDVVNLGTLEEAAKKLGRSIVK